MHVGVYVCECECECGQYGNGNMQEVLCPVGVWSGFCGIEEENVIEYKILQLSG